MNYTRIHNNIIANAMQRTETIGYSEVHHIVPRCMGGDNAKENLVRLTAKEHYLIHRLLTLIYPDINGLRIAFWFMCNKTKNERYIPSGIAYNHARLLFSEINKGNQHSLGYKHKKGHKIGGSQPKTIEAAFSKAEKLRNFHTDRKHTTETIDKFVQQRAKNKKQVNQYSLDADLIKTWDSCTSVAKEFNIPVKRVSSLLRTKKKTRFGFKWDYA